MSLMVFPFSIFRFLWEPNTLDDSWFQLHVIFLQMRHRIRMTIKQDPKKDKIEEYIKENLKQVFSEFEQDQMPDQLTDLLLVLRAQDEELKAKK